MPTYVYKFVETGETIEVQQAFTDDALIEAVHPSTGTLMQVKKVFTPVGVTFKGGGFYKTDSRGGSKSTSSSSTGSGDSGSTSTTPSSTESSKDSSKDSSKESKGSSAPTPAPATSSSSSSTSSD